MQKNITPKEYETAVNIVNYCCGDHTRKEIEEYIRVQVRNMTKEERCNIAKMLEAVLAKL